MTAEKTDAAPSDPGERRVRGPGIAKIRENTPTPDPRGAAVKETAGALTGAHGPGYLRGLREDWPA
jgi:hypothetical protein